MVTLPSSSVRTVERRPAARWASWLLAACTGAAIGILTVMAAGVNRTVVLGPFHVGLHDYVKPLAWGTAAAALLLFLNRECAPWRRVAIAALAVLGALGVLDFAIWSVPIVTDSDIAVSELYIELASRGRLLVGPYSRFGWHHPGPLYFYLAAPFYALSGRHAAALYATATAINVASLTTMVWVMARSARWHVTTMVVGACVLFAWRLPRFLASPWNAHVAVLPTLAFLVIAAAVASGRVRLLAGMVLFGSFAAQTHAGFVPVVAAVSALAVVAAVVGYGRGDSSPWAALNAAAWLGAVLWIVPVSEALSHGGGNIAALGRFFITNRGPGHSIGEAIAYGSHGLAALLRSNLELPWGGRVELSYPWLGVCIAVAETVLLALVAPHDFRAGRKFEGWLAVVALAATAAGIAAVTRIAGDILRYDLLRISAIGALNLGVLGAAGWRAASTAVQRAGSARESTERPEPAGGGHWRPWAGAAVHAVLLTAIAAVAVRDLISMTEAERRQHNGSPIVAASRAVRDYMAANGVRRPLIRIDVDRWGDAAGVLLRLLQDSRAASLRPADLPMFSDAFAPTGDEDAVVTFADLDLHRELRQQPGTVILLQAFPLFIDVSRTPPAPDQGEAR